MTFMLCSINYIPRTRSWAEYVQAESAYDDLKGRAMDAAASGQQRAGEALEGVRSAVDPAKVHMYITCIAVHFVIDLIL